MRLKRRPKCWIQFMPIAISFRNGFSECAYRDTLVRALKLDDIECAYFTSGFFSDFTHNLERRSPDFVFNQEMEGKQVFLLGGYNDKEKISITALRDSLIKRGLKASAKVLDQDKDVNSMKTWHAKTAVFLSQRKPVLAIVGSSNLTGASMYGNSEKRFLRGPHNIQIEAESFYWLKEHLNIAQAMHDVFNYWGGKCNAEIAFDHEMFDGEIKKLTESVYRNILSFQWTEA